MNGIVETLNEALFTTASKILKSKKGKFEACVILPLDADKELMKKLDSKAITTGTPIEEGRIWFFEKSSDIIA